MTSDFELSKNLLALRAAAAQRIREKMEAHGLREADGWKISEYTRELSGGSEIVFRPIHMVRSTLARLECIVRIDESTGRMTHECRCEAAP